MIVIPRTEPIACEYRGELLDLVQYGHFCVVDDLENVLWSAGDPRAVVNYRSSSKPIQTLPTLAEKLDEKYGLTAKETSILAASHKGEPFHVQVLESILKKTGLLEEDMVMNALAPTETYAYDGMPRKIYHCCSGKHASLMLLQRELTGSPQGYHLPDSPVQMAVKRVIAFMSQCAEKEVGVGIDGCGVPVYAVQLRQMAGAFLRLACPDLIEGSEYHDAAVKIRACMNAYPEMIRGSNSICLTLNKDPNIIAKSGANGLYCLALTKQRLGIAVKLIDGTPDWLPFVVRHILLRLHYENQKLLDELASYKPDQVTNACSEVVGHREFLL